MANNTQNYQYLLHLYTVVNAYLDQPAKQENLPDIIVSFCIVVEKLFKIKLHKESPVLVCDSGALKKDEVIINLIKGIDQNTNTIRIRETIGRYNLMFQGEFTDTEMQSLLGIYDVRNHFVHDYRADDDTLSNKDDLLNIMGTVWERISAIAISIFGQELIKSSIPKKKYSEEELENVLIEEVKKKIAYLKKTNGLPLAYSILNEDFPALFSGEKCPRCGSYGFSVDNTENSSTFTYRYTDGLHSMADLYKCKECHLELTRKEFEIAKKEKSKTIISNSWT